MTTMHTGGLGSYQAEDMPREERTSILAILSLIFGIVAICIPGMGVIGAILGISALIFIGGSGGRLAGKGLAIAGIACSILLTFLWAAVLWGAIQMSQKFAQFAVGPADSVMRSIDAGDFTAAKARLTGVTGQKITDADFAAFASAYQAELGHYKSAPAGLVPWFQGIIAMGPAMQSFQGRQNTIPMPMTFDKGQAILAVMMDPTASYNSNNTSAVQDLPMSNLQIVTKGGKTITLYDPNNRPLPPDLKIPEAPKAPEAPKSQDEPKKPDAPK